MLRGKEAISEYLSDVFGRDMTHRVESEVVGEGRVVFNVAWRVSGRDACARRGEPRLARRQDCKSGGGRGLGRVELLPTDGGPKVYPTLMMT